MHNNNATTTSNVEKLISQEIQSNRKSVSQEKKATKTINNDKLREYDNLWISRLLINILLFQNFVYFINNWVFDIGSIRGRVTQTFSYSSTSTIQFTSLS